MYVVVGLGNPGKQYENTRHNTGFMVLDRLSEKLNIEMTQNKFKGLYVKSKYKGNGEREAERELLLFFIFAHLYDRFRLKCNGIINWPNEILKF